MINNQKQMLFYLSLYYSMSQQTNIIKHRIKPPEISKRAIRAITLFNKLRKFAKA